MNKLESVVAVLPLTPHSEIKHVVLNVIPQPRPTEKDSVVAFKAFSEEGTIVKHTVHSPHVLPVGDFSSTIQQEKNPFTGFLERVND